MWKIPEKYRVEQSRFGKKGELHGAFLVPSPDKSRITKTNLFIIASNGTLQGAPMQLLGLTEADKGWEHISVHASKTIGKTIKQMIPTWEEMCFVKSLFWDEEDIVFQIHPAKSSYFNQHQFTLHLWRHPEKEFPMPPTIFVGMKKN